MTPLPSRNQAYETRRLINRGRNAMGMRGLLYLDFDGASPGSTTNCFAARNVYFHAGAYVGKDSVYLLPTHAHSLDALWAMGSKQISKGQFTIPNPILAVTRAFDDRVEGLRERLVEAGVVQDT